MEPEASTSRVLSYESGRAPGGLPREVSLALTSQLGVAIGSAVCVAASFAALWGNATVAAVHAVIYVAAVAGALRAAVLMRQVMPAPRSWWKCEIIASVALLVIGFTPLVAGSLATSPGSLMDQLGWVGRIVVATAVLVLAGTTCRHHMLCDTFADWAEPLGSGRHGMELRVIGYTKMICDAGWLAICALTIVASEVVSTMFVLFATIAFAVVWMWMFEAHLALIDAGRTGGYDAVEEV